MGAGRAQHRRAGPPPIVLASSSPQRRAILMRLGVQFTVRAAAVRELADGEPARLVQANALRKARAVRAPGARELVIGCDTLVALDGVVYGKPADEASARATLTALSGATHEVLSGLALLRTAGEGPSGRPPAGQPARGEGHGEERVALARTAVTFRELGKEVLDWYLARGEWRGRAGGYAIQEAGAALVRAVDGDYENVVGLPLATLIDLCPGLLH